METRQQKIRRYRMQVLNNPPKNLAELMSDNQKLMDYFEGVNAVNDVDSIVKLKMELDADKIRKLEAMLDMKKEQLIKANSEMERYKWLFKDAQKSLREFGGLSRKLKTSQARIKELEETLYLRGMDGEEMY